MTGGKQGGTSQLSNESKRVLDSLWTRWHLAWYRLAEFKRLFCESEERLKLLNAVTRGVFLHDVQYILQKEVALCVTRLLDPSGRQDNLSLWGLWKRPEVKREAAFAGELRKAIHAAEENCRSCE